MSLGILICFLSDRLLFTLLGCVRSSVCGLEVRKEERSESGVRRRDEAVVKAPGLRSPLEKSAHS